MILKINSTRGHTGSLLVSTRIIESNIITVADTTVVAKVLVSGNGRCWPTVVSGSGSGIDIYVASSRSCSCTPIPTSNRPNCSSSRPNISSNIINSGVNTVEPDFFYYGHPWDWLK